ncbi:hypothetical protein HIM_03378 [Hirsutella minnesotensis 3608]|uniref:Vacuolar import and degradation protein 21 n=1 Tax=Hirsutella minnesotensis 3608 TaxID=1043627 RepID=A0A0F8A2J7_9HYPO|nr:hypothetical protein HIM_03378 [Hirsutella minnesotensis 3608]
MTEVGHADLSRILQSRRHECSAIVTSRKRKLRELFAVATQIETLPDDGFANPDAPAATPAEWQFLQASDILQGKTLNELNIPVRPRLSVEKLRRLVADSVNAVTSSPDATPPKHNGVLDPQSQHASPDVSANAKDGRPQALVGKNVRLPSPAKALPVPSSQCSTPRLPSSVVPITITKAATPPHIRRDGASTVSHTANGEFKQLTKEDASKRAAQVKFPPGTKGSPSEEAANSGTVSLNNAMPSTATAGGKLEPGFVDSRVEESGMSFKSGAETPKIPEALSTPGSTAASAETPAVHDVSTDTSPDREGPRYFDVHGGKESDDAGREGRTSTRVVDPQDQGLSAEEQLIRESLQSSVASKPEEKPELSTGQALNEFKPPKPLVSVEALPKPSTVQTGLLAPEVPPACRSQAAEIPDSQEQSPEAMAVDVETQHAKPEASSHPSMSPKQSDQILPEARPVSPSAKGTEMDQLPPSERAVTRVSSGAMRLKSVNEIVGGPSRSLTANRDKEKNAQEQLTPVTSTPQSPAVQARQSSAAKRDVAKSHASTVLFGKQPKRIEDRALIASHKETIQAADDYYTPLFVQNFTGSSKWMQPLERILFQANKIISTPDAHLVIQDHQACRVLRRVYHLQQHDKWSLRQPKRCPEATRPPTQWDSMLQEMKWMRTDFREERKWKRAVARNLAYACAEWHEASPEDRRYLQVETVIPPRSQDPDQDTAMADAENDTEERHPTPDLMSSVEGDSPQNVEEIPDNFVDTVAPSAIFALQEDDVVFGLRRTPASDKLLEELPMYGSPLKVLSSNMASPEFDPDAHWRRPALPLSKYVEGEMKLATKRPSRKRSRFDYANEDDEDEDEKTMQFVRDDLSHHVRLPPSTDEVSLFNPESKHIRDRLHAGHQFRPPSEHPMPTQSFYESRSPSQWTVAEDDELRGLVREYSYNWSLISSILSTKSAFVAGAERRTPWECFERWIGLEGLPSDMQKTQYFKAYNTRIEAAQRVIAHQNQIAAQQATASGGAVTPIRRRPSIPVRVERRRNQKHLTLLDAMRKLAKKRETAIQKQQHSATQNAANKKPSESPSTRPAKTPRDYSLMRWERDQALAEKMAQYAQRQEAQRRAALQARAQAQAAQVAGAPGGNAAGANASNLGANPGINAAGRPVSQLAAAAAVAATQNRPRMPMQPPPNGVGVGAVQTQMNGNLSNAAQMNGTAQAPMQAAQAQHRMPMPNQQPDANLMLRAQRISEQQRAAVQIQQAQQQQHQQTQQHQPPQHQQPQPQSQQGNPGTPGGANQHNLAAMRNGINGIAQQTFMNNAQAMMASYAAAAANGSGLGTAQANGLHMPATANTPSPAPRVHSQLPPGIAAQLNHLEASFRAKNPNLTPEQARQLATEHLTRAMMAQRQNAMNAAAGASGQAGLATSLAGTTSPHQYAALLRQQQQQQQTQQQQQQPPPPQQHKAPPHQAQQLQQQHQHHLLQQHQRQQAAQQKAHPPVSASTPTPQLQQKQPLQQAQQAQHAKPQPQYQQHAAVKQGTPVPAGATPTPASASPALSHQHTSSGSATPSAAGK